MHLGATRPYIEVRLVSQTSLSCWQVAAKEKTSANEGNTQKMCFISSVGMSENRPARLLTACADDWSISDWRQRGNVNLDNFQSAMKIARELSSHNFHQQM